MREFRQALAKRFTVKDKVLGAGANLGELQETRVLNRIIRWTPRGWEYEADQRHAELIIRGMGMENAKSVKPRRRCTNLEVGGGRIIPR